MSRTSQIQQLYVGLLGRAADAEGLQYWNDTGLSIAEIANWIVESAEEFPRTDRGEAVNALYANLFNRAPDAEGENYWVNESQVSIDELVLHLIEWADPTDAAALNNRTFVANAYTSANAGEELDLEAAAAVIAEVDHTNKSVSDALDTIGASTADLAALVEELQEAQTNQAEFLKAWGEENDVANATAAEVNIALSKAADKVGVTLTPTITPAQIQAAIDTAKADNEFAVLAAQEALKTQTEIVNETDGLKARVDSYIRSYDIAVAADKTATKSGNALAGALHELGLNNGETYTASFDADSGVLTITDGAAVSTYNGSAWTADALELSDAIKALAVTSQKDEVAADTTSGNAQARLASIDSGATVDLTKPAADQLSGDAAAYATAATELAAAEKVVSDFNKALVEYQEAAVATGTVKSLGDAITAATDAITEDADVELFVVGSKDDTATFIADFLATDGDDLFVLAPQEDTAPASYTVADFGFLGNDVIYAAGYSQGSSIKTGDNSALEFFVTEKSGDTVLTFETSVFGSSAAVQETFDIVLTGVSANDLTFVDGFISVA